MTGNLIVHLQCFRIVQMYCHLEHPLWFLPTNKTFPTPFQTLELQTVCIWMVCSHILPISKRHAHSVDRVCLKGSTGCWKGFLSHNNNDCPFPITILMYIFSFSDNRSQNLFFFLRIFPICGDKRKEKEVFFCAFGFLVFPCVPRFCFCLLSLSNLQFLMFQSCCGLESPFVFFPL